MRLADKAHRAAVSEKLFCPEAPSATDAGNASAAGGFYVHLRIAYIDSFILIAA